MDFEKVMPPRLDKSKLIGVIAPADPVAGVWRMLFDEGMKIYES